MSARAIWTLLSALALAVANAGAQASQLVSNSDTSVLASQSLLLQQSGANATTLAIPGAGELFVTLSDLKFPTSFASLEYAVTDADGTLIPLTNAGTEMTLDLTAPTTLYADVFATLGGNVGLYNFTATFVSSAPVPLPDSALSFAGGAVLLVLVALCADCFAQRRDRAHQHAFVTTPMA
jgi:hypothetical protein